MQKAAEKATMATQIVAILVCVTINFALQISNKWLVSVASFKQPISMTCSHFLVIAMMGSGMTWAGVNKIEHITSRRQAFNIFILAASVAASIVTGIWALQYISVAMDVAIGCTTPAWTAMLVGQVLGLQESRAIWTSLLVTIVGSTMATGADPQFHIVGLFLSFISTLTRAVKSVMQQKLMSTDKDKFNPINLTMYMSAFGLIILVPFAFVLEGHSFMDTLTEHMENAARGHPTLASIGRTATWVLLINMFLAFGYTLSQYWMTKVTSAVTSQVVGTSKNAVLSTISFLFFGDTITVPAFLGYLTVFGGAGVYTYLRIHGHTATAPVYAPLSAGGTRVAEA